MNYKIIEGFGDKALESLAFKCGKAVEEGWIPAGGLAMSMAPEYGVVVAQAMWKPLDKEEHDGRNL